jgi:hypothetical protein
LSNNAEILPDKEIRMRGLDFQRPSPEIIDILSKGSTASYTTIFSRKGIRDIWKSRWQNVQTICPHCPNCAPIAHQGQATTP